MADVFQNFKEILMRLKRENTLSDEVRLILLGRMEYTAERGDLTPQQMLDLMEEMGQNFRAAVRNASMLASVGEVLA